MRNIGPMAAFWAALTLAGCASPVVWVKPGANELDFSADRARCQLMAEGMNPDPGIATISTGKVGTDIAANIGAGVLHGIAQGMKEAHTFSLCMQASGYVPTNPEAPAPRAAPAPGPLALVPSAPAAPLPAVAAPAPAAVAEPVPAVAPRFVPCNEGGSCSGGGRSLSVSTF